MSPITIIYPVCAMVLLTLAVTFRLGYLNLRAVKNREVSVKYFKIYKGEDVPNYLVTASQHYKNLFEAPVLFYVVCILLFLTNEIDRIDVALAWLFVGLRYIHSYTIATTNFVPHRFRAFVISFIVLLGLWIKFFLKIV